MVSSHESRPWRKKAEEALLMEFVLFYYDLVLLLVFVIWLPVATLLWLFGDRFVISSGKELLAYAGAFIKEIFWELPREMLHPLRA